MRNSPSILKKNDQRWSMWKMIGLTVAGFLALFWWKLQAQHKFENPIPNSGDQIGVNLLTTADNTPNGWWNSFNIAATSKPFAVFITPDLQHIYNSVGISDTTTTWPNNFNVQWVDLSSQWWQMETIYTMYDDTNPSDSLILTDPLKRTDDNLTAGGSNMEWINSSYEFPSPSSQPIGTIMILYSGNPQILQSGMSVWDHGAAFENTANGRQRIIYIWQDSFPVNDDFSIPLSTDPWKMQISSYPNPTSNLLNFDGLFEGSHINIYNSEWELVFDGNSLEVVDGKVTINVSNLPNGKYTAFLYEGNDDETDSGHISIVIQK